MRVATPPAPTGDDESTRPRRCRFLSADPDRVLSSHVSSLAPLLPAPVVALLDVALVGELTVIDQGGRPVTYPLIPLSDGDLIYLTSSVLFSRKLRHIKTNPKVCLSLTDPVAVPVEPFHRATIQGDARVVEDDVHEVWERLLPLWRAKERPSTSS